MSQEGTTIKVSTENWKWMNVKKMNGDSFDDILDRMIDAIEENDLKINTEEKDDREEGND